MPFAERQSEHAHPIRGRKAHHLAAAERTHGGVQPGGRH